MKERKKVSVELGSQDLTLKHLEILRKIILKNRSATGKDRFQELIMFSSKTKPFQYSSVDDLKSDLGLIPDDTGYFYYTVTYPTGDRCALYLDPDRPTRVVVEGEDEFVSDISNRISREFPKGGSRYKVHSGWGFLSIWAIVLLIAIGVIIAYSLLSEVNPYLIAWVIFVSSALGAYISVVKAKEINPANTMALGGNRKRPLVDTILHLITITLGIISVVLVILFIEFNI